MVKVDTGERPVVLLGLPYGGKEGRRVELISAIVVFFTYFFTHSGSQVPGRDPSSMAAATESRHQSATTNCFGSRSR